MTGRCFRCFLFSWNVFVFKSYFLEINTLYRALLYVVNIIRGTRSGPSQDFASGGRGGGGGGGGGRMSASALNPEHRRCENMGVAGVGILSKEILKK